VPHSFAPFANAWERLVTTVMPKSSAKEDAFDTFRHKGAKRFNTKGQPCGFVASELASCDGATRSPPRRLVTESGKFYLSMHFISPDRVYDPTILIGELHPVNVERHPLESGQA
jgi:hypothetical protein